MNVRDDSNLLTHVHTSYTHVDALAQAHTENDLFAPSIFDVYKEMVNSNSRSGHCDVTVNMQSGAFLCVCECVFWSVSMVYEKVKLKTSDQNVCVLLEVHLKLTLESI